MRGERECGVKETKKGVFFSESVKKQLYKILFKGTDPLILYNRSECKCCKYGVREVKKVEFCSIHKKRINVRL
jgi:hypothetical protein